MALSQPEAPQNRPDWIGRLTDFRDPMVKFYSQGLDPMQVVVPNVEGRHAGIELSPYAGKLKVKPRDHTISVEFVENGIFRDQIDGLVGLVSRGIVPDWLIPLNQWMSPRTEFPYARSISFGFGSLELVVSMGLVQATSNNKVLISPPVHDKTYTQARQERTGKPVFYAAFDPTKRQLINVEDTEIFGGYSWARFLDKLHRTEAASQYLFKIAAMPLYVAYGRFLDIPDQPAWSAYLRPSGLGFDQACQIDTRIYHDIFVGKGDKTFPPYVASQAFYKLMSAIESGQGTGNEGFTNFQFHIGNWSLINGTHKEFALFLTDFETGQFGNIDDRMRVWDASIAFLSAIERFVKIFKLDPSFDIRMADLVVNGILGYKQISDPHLFVTEREKLINEFFANSKKHHLNAYAIALLMLHQMFTEMYGFNSLDLHLDFYNRGTDEQLSVLARIGYLLTGERAYEKHILSMSQPSAPTIRRKIKKRKRRGAKMKRKPNRYI